MDASIIVCTHNRAESLRDTLRALRAQQTNPDRSWELIVVDNNSHDDTRKVVEMAQRSGPCSAMNSSKPRAVACPQPGDCRRTW